jgi:hypothetical protein
MLAYRSISEKRLIINVCFASNWKPCIAVKANAASSGSLNSIKRYLVDSSDFVKHQDEDEDTYPLLFPDESHGIDIASGLIGAPLRVKSLPILVSSLSNLD